MATRPSSLELKPRPGASRLLVLVEFSREDVSVAFAWSRKYLGCARVDLIWFGSLLVLHKRLIPPFVFLLNLYGIVTLAQPGHVCMG